MTSSIRDNRGRTRPSGLLTGAEALAESLARFGASTAFAYPGTSELAICAKLNDVGFRVRNARGDKEAVFMAAGFNAVKGGGALAVLHGARGLTNALGAIADVRRSELPVLCVVGLPSGKSAPYLPPHGEAELIAGAGHFACRAVDCSKIDAFDGTQFVQLLSDALEPAPGPVLFGLPHDLAVTPFVPQDAIPVPPLRSEGTLAGLGPALTCLRAAAAPLVLVDDYALGRDEHTERAIGEFASILSAPVFQVAYSRGPMLFQRARPDFVPTLRGLYDPRDPDHAAVVAAADLIVTVEDRNMYPRVVGPLPPCRKIAITSRAEATRKNGYLGPNDYIIEGSPERVLLALADGLGRTAQIRAQQCRLVNKPAVQPAASAERLVSAIGRALSGVQRPHVVDDGQMFGGLVAKHYSYLPPEVRILGSHGGFVGGGLATAVGVAQAVGPTVCLLGDQGFTNGVGALAAAGDLNVPLAVIVCNNGSAVSLRIQSEADDLSLHRLDSSLLANGTRMGYAEVARGYGLDAQRLLWPDDDAGELAVESAATLTVAVLSRALQLAKPFLLELVVPGSIGFWKGIWRVDGNEGRTPVRPKQTD